MLKKTAALLLVLCVFGLSACGKAENKTDVSNITSQTESAASQAENSDETDITSDAGDTASDGNSSSEASGSDASTPTSAGGKEETANPPSSTTAEPDKKPEKPAVPNKELINIHLNTDVPTKDLPGFDGADCISIDLTLKENANGSFSSTYYIYGWKCINKKTASKSEQDKLLASANRYQSFWRYDDDISSEDGTESGLYWGWVTYDYGDYYSTFEELMSALGSGWDKNPDTEYFPSEIFGSRIVYFAEDVSCSYDKGTGKLTISSFPLSDIYISDANSFTLYGKAYRAQSITGY